MERWDRQCGETDAAYAAFKVYLTMVNRSLQKVAESLHKDSTLIRRWSAKNDWRERADAWDESIIEAERQERIANRRQNLNRQEEFANLLIDKAAEILRKANTARGSFYAATQMADLGFRLIREVDDTRSKSDGGDSPILIKFVDAGEGDD